MTDEIKKLLNPYRARVDVMDRQIVDMFAARYKLVSEIAQLKAEHDMPAVIPARIEEVRENAARHAGDIGLDENFIRHLWAQLIDHTCALEDRIIAAYHKKRA